MKKFLKWTGITLTGLFLLLGSLVGFGAVWGLTKWGDIDIDEIIFQLQSPLQGTESGMLTDYFLKGLLPAVLLTALYIAAQILLNRKKTGPFLFRFTVGCFALTLAGCLGVGCYIWGRLKVGDWLAARTGSSAFIEEHYVDPKEVTLEFPEKKRNLIYIYLESIETTFADEASGGAFEENLIPELTRIAQEAEDFSGEETALNGGVSFIGTTFTTGGIFAQTAGLPLRLTIGTNNMDAQDTFFPAIKTMGDILREQGYHQVFMCGSDATFGGRRLFFHDHGDFEFSDHPSAIEQGLLPEDYNVFWGYEDEKLFDFAKEKLLSLSQEDQPFNFTMLTADTHFPDGYVCPLCREDFGDNRYANVIACSSRQTADFLSWIREQDFYENTTIVLHGDHPTMKKGFADGIDPAYQRKTYTAYINSACEVMDSSKRREYSTFDDFPTTLASMGVKIEGERLGLGTNLFADVPTLSEEYGTEEVGREVSMRSAFLEELEKTDDLSEQLVERYKEEMKESLEVTSGDSPGEIRIRMKLGFTSPPKVDSYVAVLRETGQEKEERLTLKMTKDNTKEYAGTMNLSHWKKIDGDLRVEMNLTSGGILEDLTSIHLSALTFLHEDLTGYLKALKTEEEFREAAVLFSVKDEGTQKLTQENLAAMKALGMEQVEEAAGKARISYLALVHDGEVTEKCGYEELELSGVLGNTEIPYRIVSGGHDNGRVASIRIDETEMALNHRGMNIVVFDAAAHQMIDTVVFDVYSQQ